VLRQVEVLRVSRRLLSHARFRSLMLLNVKESYSTLLIVLDVRACVGRAGRILLNLRIFPNVLNVRVNWLINQANLRVSVGESANRATTEGCCLGQAQA
jgi:hypothetical protein